MKTILFIVLLASSSWATCPLYQSRDPQTNQENQNMCQQITNPTINNGTANTMTVTNLIVSSLSGINIGKILQVQYYTTTSSSQTTSATFVPTNSYGAITPKATTSRILACAFGTVQDFGGSQGVQLAIFRNTTNLCDATGCANLIHSASGSEVTQTSMCVVDSPSSASALTYTVEFLSTDPPGNPAYGNGRTQTLILMEIGQ